MATSEIPEPPDGPIVGWGYPLRYVLVRIDEYEEALAMYATYEPFLLVQRDLAVEAPDGDA